MKNRAGTQSGAPWENLVLFLEGILSKPPGRGAVWTADTAVALGTRGKGPGLAGGRGGRRGLGSRSVPQTEQTEWGRPASWGARPSSC